MVMIDMTRLHYCLEYEYAHLEEFTLNKWRAIPELASFLAYVINQWFRGTFSNWHIYKTPAGFANTNNPMESFNKIIKAYFTRFLEHRLLQFILLIIEHLIPFYSNNIKEFMFYRIPHSKTIKLAKNLVASKFVMDGKSSCSYTGSIHVHKLNFELRSCTCRWFLAFRVCSHLVAACDIFKVSLERYTKARSLVYRARRGRKAKTLTFSAAAFAETIVVPIPMLDIESRRPDLFLINSAPMPLPSLNPSYASVCEPVETVSDPVETVEPLPVPKAALKRIVTRSYKKNDAFTVVERVKQVKRIDKSIPFQVLDILPELPEKRKPGRPRKITSALNV